MKKREDKKTGNNKGDRNAYEGRRDPDNGKTRKLRKKNQ